MKTEFSFTYGPKVRSGPGSTAAMADVLPDGPVLFVTDGTIRKLGLANAALTALRAGGREIAIFEEVEADPSVDTVCAAKAAGEEIGACSVVGFGGGSPMDVAKTVAYLLGSGDELEDIYGVDQAHGERLPLVLVPTTAGTGSEATPIAILTVGGAEKKGIVTPAIYADWAFLDADLTTGLPRAVTAATGIDAMVHAIEAYTSKRLKNPLSDALAREALRILSAHLRAACDEPDNKEARGQMLLGAHLAGVSFSNAPVAGVHALAYPLGGHFHVPHGLSNALMLPHVLGHNMEAARELYAELAVDVNPKLGSLGTQGRAQGFVEELRALITETGLSPRLRDVGVEASHLDLLASEAMKQERLLINNPVEIDQAAARRLYEAAL